jgi:aldehyde dehydrogenase (NAD+)
MRLSRRAARVVSLICSEYVRAARELPLLSATRDRAGAAVIRRRPVGVVAAIGAWNGPLLVVANKAVPALLAGCTVVAKPAAETPFDAGLFADAVPQSAFRRER